MTTSYISYGYVDRFTGEPFDSASSLGGPVTPEGVDFGFALESEYPTSRPRFYGVTSGRTDLPGITGILTSDQYEAARESEMQAREKLRVAASHQSIEFEKTRRIENGFSFMGKRIQSRTEDRENIAGAKSAAQDAKSLGAEPGDFGWQILLHNDGAEVFAWITLDNSLLPLDADQMIEMGYAAMLHKQRLIFKAKSLKDRVVAGEIINASDDELWD